MHLDDTVQVVSNVPLKSRLSIFELAALIKFISHYLAYRELTETNFVTYAPELPCTAIMRY